MPLTSKLLQNLTFDGCLNIQSVKDGVHKLQGKNLEVVHIYIDHLADKTWERGNRKRYFNVSKLDLLTKLDEWVFKNLVKEDDYSKYINKYLPLKIKLKYTDIDEYILNKHYRPQAVKILSKTKKTFDLAKWTKKKFKYDYQRKTNLYLKDGSLFRFDFRNWLESLFILKEQGDKVILGIGGGGSSGQRENYTKFTAIFYLLGKKQKIKHHLLKYNAENEFEYVKGFDQPIVTFDLGSNYDLSEDLRKEIKENCVGLEWLVDYKIGKNSFRIGV